MWLQSNSKIRVWQKYTLHTVIITLLTFNPCPGALTEDRQRKVPEFVLLFAVFDESKSWYRDRSRADKLRKSPGNHPQFHTINGYVNSTLKGLVSITLYNQPISHSMHIYTIYIYIGFYFKIFVIYLEMNDESFGDLDNAWMPGFSEIFNRFL